MNRLLVMKLVHQQNLIELMDRKMMVSDIRDKGIGTLSKVSVCGNGDTIGFSRSIVSWLSISLPDTRT